MTTVTTTTNKECVELKNIKYKTMLSGNVLHLWTLKTPIFKQGLLTDFPYCINN